MQGASLVIVPNTNFLVNLEQRKGQSWHENKSVKEWFEAAPKNSFLFVVSKVQQELDKNKNNRDNPNFSYATVSIRNLMGDPDTQYRVFLQTPHSVPDSLKCDHHADSEIC